MGWLPPRLVSSRVLLPRLPRTWVGVSRTSCVLIGPLYYGKDSHVCACNDFNGGCYKINLREYIKNGEGDDINIRISMRLRGRVWVVKVVVDYN